MEINLSHLLPFYTTLLVYHVCSPMNNNQDNAASPQFENKMLRVRIYIGAELEYETLGNISCFIGLKYAFIALVILL